MEILFKINIKPFQVPNFVIVDGKPGLKLSGFKESSSIPLAELDPEQLSVLCDEFRSAVFAKAGKEEPRTCGAG